MQISTNIEALNKGSLYSVTKKQTEHGEVLSKQVKDSVNISAWAKLAGKNTSLIEHDTMRSEKLEAFRPWAGDDSVSLTDTQLDRIIDKLI